MHNKYKYLLKNMGLLTLSSFATKLLSFFLVPLYTAVLSTEEYGTYDLFSTTISLLVPILTIDIQEAVLRFSIDDKDNKDEVLAIGITYFFYSTLFFSALLLVNFIFDFVTIFNDYTLEFFLLFTCTNFNGIISYFTRGTGRIRALSISSVLSSLTTIILNILFLVVLKIGLRGYFYATILGNLVQIIYLLFSLKVKPYLLFHKNDNRLEQEMTSYSKPMVANAVSWWVNNASDRYVVTFFGGVAANGVYSVSYKIPSIISVLEQIFGQAWTLSAVKDFDKDDKTNFFRNIYNLYNYVLLIFCSLLIAFNKPIAKLLFSKDFYAAWQFAPFLLIGTLFSGMAAFLGGIFSAKKNSSIFARTSVITAITNTVGNIILVYLIGPLGASISTAFAYMLMWWLRIHSIRKDISLRINLKRDLVAYFIIIIQSFLMVCIQQNFIFSVYQIIFPIILIILYWDENILIIRKIKKVF